ncbi:MAG: helix-turn-helix domain-containing protein [Candidatus Thiodiazotropha sp. (ex. Lucinisca nassula)]|nr:helix-turn-helix domain-containing protein [Candidatus Thiodiazotropha sp. (ex. Lucinisca nassula)]MBW9275048.1 helix-turn-helix domain-containing protein [Candidatus Thiodiazotropha sp. (ex. Lucinisca nassula)]
MNTFLDRKQFGQRLREERKRLGLSQDALAARGGITRTAQFLYEKGERAPSIEYLAMIHTAGIDFRYILTGEHSASAGGKICLETEVLAKAFNLVDEICRDSKGRLLERQHRMELMVSICQSISDEPEGDIDWNTFSQLESARTP